MMRGARENAMGNRYAGVKQIDKVLRLGKTRAAPWRAAPCRLPFPPALLPNDPHNPSKRTGSVCLHALATLLAPLHATPHCTAPHHNTLLHRSHAAPHRATPRRTTRNHVTLHHRSSSLASLAPLVAHAPNPPSYAAGPGSGPTSSPHPGTLPLSVHSRAS